MSDKEDEKKSEKANMRLKPSVKAYLLKKAKENYRSLSKEIEMRIEKSIELETLEEIARRDDELH